MYGELTRIISMLQKCRKEGNLAHALRLHDYISNLGLGTHKSIGNYIVPMLVECGSVPHAHQVFNSLVYANEHSWTSLISGFVECGQSEHAFLLYHKMQEAHIRPSRYTLMYLLKACGKLKNIEKGKGVHVETVEKGLDTDLFIGSTLVDMYAKCGSLLDAQRVFDKLPIRNVVSWNALIAGYAENGHGNEAAKCFECMRLENVSPNAVTFVYILKAYSSIGAIGKCREIHMEITERGLDTDIFVGSTLVAIYAKCGSLSDAQKVFNKLPVRNVVSWTALISGYAEHGAADEALKCFEQMQHDCVPPNAVTIVFILKAYASIGALEKVWQMYKAITGKTFEGGNSDIETKCSSHFEACVDMDPFIGSTLVEIYVKYSSLVEAQEVFDGLPVRNVMTWNALISGYIQHGHTREALRLFEKMQLDGISPDTATFVCMLKACGSIGGLDKGREIHVQIREKGFDTDLFVGSTLVDMYAKCGSLQEAQEAFDKLPNRNVVSWTALIAGYAEHGPGKEALKCFKEMQEENISPNATTFVCILKACSNIGAIDEGREVHKEIIEKGFEMDIFLSNTLIDMYAKYGLLSEAQEIFAKVPVRNVVSWNAIIAGYTEHGVGSVALKYFEEMQFEGICPNAVTFVCILKACGSTGAINQGQKIHRDITQMGFETDRFIGSSLVDMYGKCGLLSEAQAAFDKLLIRDVISWTALIAGYAEHGPACEALRCFEQMQLDGIIPDAITFICGLKVCGSTGSIGKGRGLHANILQCGFEKDHLVGSSLIDMYAECGLLSEAQEIFNKLPAKNAVLWSAMIHGYGMNHKGQMAVQCFESMQEEGVKPDAITFTCLLTACSHAKLAFKGKMYFNMMREEYGIIPTIDHCTSVVDLLVRSGCVYEAARFLETMPCSPSIETWTALLSGCETYGEPEIGLRCFYQLVELDSAYAASYIFMSNIYATADRKDDAYKIELLRQLSGAKKKPASALIEVNKKLFEFTVGCVENREISAMMEVLISHMDDKQHIPNLDLVMRPMSDQEKETVLCGHAEKLAIAFGLLNTPQGHALHVTKNIRMCNNCHNVNKTISLMERRQIVVRDSYCVHYFKDGLCSCGDAL